MPDTLHFNICTDPVKSIVTKRHILSFIAQIFDPLGLLGACIVTAKILLQELWLHQLSWDDTVPKSIQTTWNNYITELQCLNNFTIPRHALCKSSLSVQIHGFSDASERAYGICIYLRSVDNNGNIHSHLLCSKSKVAPLKTVNIPRLELCAALLLANLITKVKKSLITYIKVDNVILWSDSSIVLCWLRTSPNLLKTFVANRVSEIQTLTSKCTWQHVRSEDNPADLISRGISPQYLPKNDLWWHGPTWLSLKCSEWPIITKPELSSLPEMKVITKAFITEQAHGFPFKNYSNLNKLIRIVSYMKRFINNCRDKANKLYGLLTVKETNESLLSLIKIMQNECFYAEISDLSNDQIDPKSKILKLTPFLDASGILRVGGRLQNSQFSYQKKHPILLDNKHWLTWLIFNAEHMKLLHPGPQLLLASTRERFWTTSGRNLARKVTHSCIKCFRAKPKFLQPLMGNLPETRVTPTPPFYVTGVDYAGPFKIKDRQGRGCKITKGYVAVFVCYSTKAIHLELVSDLTTDCFLSAFKRFVARRGKPSQMNSDNGTTFVGANNELKQLGEFLRANESIITSNSLSKDIQWNFIPAYSPHMGGIWEAGVRSMKHHFTRVVGNALLTYENFYTILTQIEYILNSRPLSPLSSDPSDLEPLTPLHFLLGRSAENITEADVTHINENRLDKYQRLQQIKQHFWTRWSKEYICELQQRKKWTRSQQNIQLNTMVLIKDVNLPPLSWNIGRVVDIHPGQDGIVRVVSVKTVKGIMKKAVVNICPLPMANLQVEISP